MPFSYLNFVQSITLTLLETVLHTVQIKFHAMDVNKYRYIQTPIGLLIFEVIGHNYAVQCELLRDINLQPFSDTYLFGEHPSVSPPLLFLRKMQVLLLSSSTMLSHPKEMYGRPPDKSVYQKIIFFFSQSKHMLWVLKRTASMTVLLSTQNICLKRWIRKYLQFYANTISLSGCMVWHMEPE